MIRNQAQLQEGDEVTLISARAFLEAYDPELAEVVLRNLDRGVIYKYFFPAGMGNPHGDEALESYQRFCREHVAVYRFSKPPLLFGYSVDPTRFRFFSGLHRIIESLGTP
jgi:hypothetical protein